MVNHCEVPLAHVGFHCFLGVLGRNSDPHRRLRLGGLALLCVIPLRIC